jgi:hypothetical protein
MEDRTEKVYRFSIDLWEIADEETEDRYGNKRREDKLHHIDLDGYTTDPRPIAAAIRQLFTEQTIHASPFTSKEQ